MCKISSVNKKIASEVTVGAVASSLAMCVRWVLLLAQARALISPVCILSETLGKLMHFDAGLVTM